MTRIVQIVPFIGPGTGVAGVAWNLEKELQALGATVERFTFDDARRHRMRRWPKNTVLARIRGGWRMVWFSTVGTRRAKRFLAERPDAVVICHNNVMAGDVYVNHGVLLASMRARGRSRWGIYRNPIHVFIYLRDRIRYRGRTHRAVVALSEQDAADLRTTYGPVRPRVVVIPNGVDLDRFRPPTPEERQAARADLKLGTEERVAVFVGHEFSRKGLSYAIRGLEHAPSVLLMIIGGNDLIIAEAFEEAKQHGVGDRVLFLGPRSNLGRFLAAADMFVFPSAYEANALVILEALASGLPVIATPVGFAPEIIVDGENGFLVERDPRAVGERMEQLASLEVAELDEWRRRARESMVPFGWPSIAQRYLELAEEVRAERDAEASAGAAASARASASGTPASGTPVSGPSDRAGG
ncbi:glycosyltransferase family 4 protein [Agromyces aurantiacus]|uniref:Glycosyltransferase family 4 protein n=1 Tax=Agromyces aurantiacus TaxID=165814 RepID=A0ABV9R391_9MICO|nr:glycosyltransferase family 4 protein [Agromyces aurantiacus]MBM7502732.1 UDP-glucose:(heptosyl)LPS alpha-1,3-glucosyltransferase [Agromyces aurantiacus]